MTYNILKIAYNLLYNLLFKFIIYLKNLFSPNIFVIKDIKTYHKILSKDITYRSNDLNLGNLFDRYLGKCLGSLDSRNPKWGKLKKIFKPIFQIDNEIIKNNLNEIITEWNNHLKSMHPTKKSVSIYDIVNDLPLNYILYVVFGKKFVQNKNSIFCSLKNNAEKIMYNIFHNKYAKWKIYQYLNTNTNNILARFQNNWRQILESAKNDQYVIQNGLYLKILEEYNKTNIEWEYFNQTLAEIIFANKDVTYAAFCWLITYYSLYSKLLDTDNIDNYIEEIFRLSPVFPTSMPKITTKDLLFDNYKIKKDTKIVVDFFSIGKCQDWGMNDLDKFRPNRFNEIDKNKFINRFGYGSRKCPGRFIANMLFKHILLYLKDNWVFVPIRPMSLSNIKTNPNKPFLTPVHSIWPVPKNKLNNESIYYYCPPGVEYNTNIFLAISVNEKSPFLTNQSNVDKLVKILMEIQNKNNKNNKNILIFICDEITKFNLQAFNNCSLNKAIQKASQLGQNFYKLFDESITQNKANFIKVCKWNDNENMPNKDEIINFLKNQPIISKRVEIIANKFLAYRTQNKVNNSYHYKLELIKEYIYHEIPILITGVYVNNIHYKLLYYCGTREHLSKFAENKNSLLNLMIDIYEQESFKYIYDKIISLSEIKKPKIKGFVGIEL